MPLQSRISHKCNKLIQAYLKGEQLLLEFVVDGKHRPVRILRRGQRSLIDELRSHLCSCGSKKRFSISVESMNGDSYIIENHTAFVLDVTRRSTTTKAPIPPHNNRNPMVDFFADHGSWLPPASKRIFVISPLIGPIASETILEEEEEEEKEAGELNAIICHQSDQSSSPPPTQIPHTTRPLSYNPHIALQALYKVTRHSGTLSTPELPSTLSIGTSRPNASSEMAQNASAVANDELVRFQASIPADIRDSMEKVGGMARSRRRGCF